jgi:hypothetical protein
MKAILHVQSWPSSPDRVDEFNRWYDEVHLPQVLQLEGFVSARRYAPVGDGPYITQYELSGDPQAAVQEVVAAATDGRLTMSDAMQFNPPPNMWVLRQVTEQG